MMKRLCTYLNEKGQDLVEYTLLLAFCAALLMGLNSDVFNQTIRAVFEKGVFEDVSTVITAGNAYKEAVEKWSQSSRRTLAEVIKNKNGKYVLGEDVIPNSERIAADKQALYNIADLFLGMDYNKLKNEVFKGDNLADKWFDPNTTEGQKGILLMSYKDNVKESEDTYDPVTQQYSRPADTVIINERKGFTANEVIHWMQGDYGNWKDPNGSYNSDLDHKSTQRYLFSNEMIDPDSSKVGNTVKRNIRVNFTITDGKVSSVRVRAQQNGHDVSDLIIEKSL